MKKLLMIACLLLTVLLALPALAEPAVSDDWMDFTCEMDGVVYTLPFPLQDLLDAGWTTKDDLQETLKPNQYTLSIRLQKDDMEYYVQAINLGIDIMPISDCLVGQISLSESQAAKGGTLVLAGGVTMGTPREEVEALYGLPGYTYEGSSYTKYEYESGSYSDMAMNFDLETDEVIDLTIRNFEEPEGYNDAAYAAPSEIPEEIANYEAPTELGEDMYAFHVKVEDVLYSVPAPYSYMVENGWRLGQKEDGKVVADGYRRMVSLVLGGYKMSTQLYNPSDKATAPEYCAVTTLRFDAASKLNVELPGGITLGMEQAALVEALEALGDEYTEDDSSSLTTYLFKQDILQEIKIIVYKDSGTVSVIELTYQP